MTGPHLARRSAPRPARRAFASARYVVCLAILIVSAAGMQAVASWLGGHFRKEPLPLLKPLYAMDKSGLAPQYELATLQPPPLSEELVANLGTKEYLDWHVLDVSRADRDAQRRARLFITYYTGQPDLVPHNPKECLGAAGYTLADETLVDVEVPDGRGGTVTLPVSVLEFEPPRRGRFEAGDGSDAMPRLVVAFFFYANGGFATTREQVRVRVANLLDRYAFYSKVEVSFSDVRGLRLATRDQTIESIKPLLSKLMPVLFTQHYQDWSAIKSDAEPAASAGSSGESGS